MNGEPQPILVSNPLADMVSTLLKDIQAGQITSVAVVAVMRQGGCGSMYAGPQRGDLFIGASSLTKKLLADIEAPQPKSSIIRAVPG
jgi:hypothetical protein